MDVFESLKRDHKEISNLLIKLQGTSKRANKARHKFFSQLKEEIELHARIEEAYFYSALERWQEMRDLINVATQEHDSAKQLLLELASLEMSDKQWDEKIKRLDEIVKSHMESEENKLFAEARIRIDRETAAELGRQMTEEKKEFLIESNLA